jgi:hypothetical protein
MSNSLVPLRSFQFLWPGICIIRAAVIFSALDSRSEARAEFVSGMIFA